MEQLHKPVLLRETIELLAPKSGGVYADATCGFGGHSAEILAKIGPDGLLIAIDRDREALEHAGKVLARVGGRYVLRQANYTTLPTILSELEISGLDGVIYDFGLSSLQIDTNRGFTYLRDEKLDMRFSQDEDIPTAAYYVNHLPEQELADVLWRFGEERYSRRIARAIVERRKTQPIETTGQLTDVIKGAAGKLYRGQSLHPAARGYQALRILVNGELDNVRQGLDAGIQALLPFGRICAISFHSLEDRIVKDAFRSRTGRCSCPPQIPRCMCGAKRTLNLINRKPIVASAAEIEANPRASSAKLRCAEKTGQQEN